MTELGEALPSRVTQPGWPWKAHPLETSRGARGGLITSCVSPLHSSALQGRTGCVQQEAHLPLFLGSLQGLASPSPIPPIRNGPAGGARAIAQAHLPIVGLRVLSFQTGTLVALTLQHSGVWPGTTKLGCLGSPRRLSWAWYRPGSHHPEPVSSPSDSGDKISSDSGAGTDILPTAWLSCASPMLVLLHTPHLILTAIP